MPDFGTVVGRLITFVVDSADPGAEPDPIPLEGEVTFTMNVIKVIEPNAAPVPVIIASTPIKAVLDSEGYICTPLANGNASSNRSITLVATDDPDMNPTGFTYTVSYALSLNGKTINLLPHSLALPAGATIDIATSIPPDNAPAVGTAQAEALAAMAVQAANSAARVVIVTDGDEPRPDGALMVIWLDLRSGTPPKPTNSTNNDIVIIPA